jgi:hypothetical protein
MKRLTPGKGKGGESMKRILSILMVSLFMVAVMAVTASVAFADPAFGPGNSGGGEGNSGPQVGKCHPPGQTTTTPGCK